MTNGVILLVHGAAPYEVFATEQLDVALISKVTPPAAEHWNNPFDYRVNYKTHPHWTEILTDGDSSFLRFWKMSPEYLARLRALASQDPNYSAAKAAGFKQVLDTYWNKT